MRIDRLEPSKRKKGRVLAYLEDGAILKLTEQEVLEHGLRRGDELGEEELERLCPDCRSRGEEELCPVCGKPSQRWGEGGSSAAFDRARFETLKGGGL